MWYRMTEELDNLIKEECYKKGLKMTEMCRAVWIHPQTYYSMKKRWVLSGRTMRRLSKKLGIDSLKMEKYKQTNKIDKIQKEW